MKREELGITESSNPTIKCTHKLLAIWIPTANSIPPSINVIRPINIPTRKTEMRYVPTPYDHGSGFIRCKQAKIDEVIIKISTRDLNSSENPCNRYPLKNASSKLACIGTNIKDLTQT